MSICQASLKFAEKLPVLVTLGVSGLRVNISIIDVIAGLRVLREKG